MKIIVKNGLKYQVTDALYKVLMEKKNFNDPNQPSFWDSNGEENQFNAQQNNNNQNNNQNNVQQNNEQLVTKVYNEINKVAVANLEKNLPENNYIQRVLYNELSRKTKNASQI